MSQIPPEVVDGLVAKMSQQVRSELSSVAVPRPPAETPAALARAAHTIRQAQNQAETLRFLLAAAGSLGTRAGLFVVKPDRLEAWDGSGFEEEATFGGVLKGVRMPLDHPATRTCIEEQTAVHCEVGGDHPVPDFGQTIRGEALLLPLVVHGKTVGMVYTDPESAQAPLDKAGLETMIELVGMRLERIASAGPQASSTTGTHAAVATPAPPAMSYQPPAEPVAPVAAAPEPMSMPSEAAAPVSDSAEPATPALSFEPAADPAPAAPAFEPAATSEPAVPMAPVSSGDPQVDDARRFARLLIDEIRLYNAEQVELGRQNQDLIDRLGDEVERARAMYERRITAEVRAKGDFFQEAVVSVLADGNAALLGHAAAH